MLKLRRKVHTPRSRARSLALFPPPAGDPSARQPPPIFPPPVRRRGAGPSRPGRPLSAAAPRRATLRTSWPRWSAPGRCHPLSISLSSSRRPAVTRRWRYVLCSAALGPRGPGTSPPPPSAAFPVRHRVATFWLRCCLSVSLPLSPRGTALRARPGCARSSRSRMCTCALVQRRSCSRRFAALRTPPPGRCLATRPVAGRRPGSVNSGQNK